MITTNNNDMMMTMIKVWLIVSEKKAPEGTAVISDPCTATVHGNLQDDKAERLWNQVSNRNLWIINKCGERWRKKRSSVCHGSYPAAWACIAALPRAGEGKPEPSLTVSFIKKEGFKSTLKCGDGFCLPDWDWTIVPQERSWITKSSGSHSTFEDFWDHQ